MCNKGHHSLNSFLMLYYMSSFAFVPISLSDRSYYNALSRVGVGFPLNFDNNKTSLLYSMGLLQYSYDIDDLKVHRNKDSDSIDILIRKAKVTVAFGTTSPNNRKYNINSKGAVLTLETRGKAQLSVDGKRAVNCQFIFAESNDLINSQMDSAVKEGLFQELQNSLGEELCDKIQL